jgi:hypothetical protein
MRYLVQAAWVRQEAAARGIAVTPRQVRRSFERQKRATFPTERDYRKFLRQSGITESDVLDRVELDLLQRRLMRRANFFLADFRARYRAITVCAESYAVAGCGTTAP